MKLNVFLTKLSTSIIVLSFVYLAIQIYTLISKIQLWIKFESTFLGILYGTFREICEILFIPLWGITIAFLFIFINNWLDNRV